MKVLSVGKAQAINALASIAEEAYDLREGGLKMIDDVPLPHLIKACLAEIYELSDV